MPLPVVVSNAAHDLGCSAATVEAEVQFTVHHVQTQKVNVPSVRHVEQQAILTRRLEAQRKLGPGGKDE